MNYRRSEQLETGDSLATSMSACACR